MELWAVGMPAGGTDWIWRLLGRFHPLVVHFPIALLCTVVMIDGWRLFRGRRAPGAVVQLLLFAGAAGAVLSAGLGWASASFEKSDAAMNGVLSLHQWLGTTVAVLAVLAALISLPARRRKSAPAVWSYRTTLWSCMALVVVASHYGGMLVYGEGYIESALPKRDAPLAPGDPGPTIVATVDFHRDIEPILQNHCVKCHGPQKVRGKLRLDTKQLAMKGGTSGRVIIPGNGKESLLYTLLLDEDPDSRMPTKEKPLPKEQINLVRLWIDQGASWPELAGERSQGKH
jgi:uncharacterized membrane protein